MANRKPRAVPIKKTTKKKLTQAEVQAMAADLEVLASQIVARSQLFSRAGLQYRNASGTALRDLYEALGYKRELIYEDYFSQYDRQDIAKAVIDKPVGATWRGGVNIIESDDDEDTALETAWDELNKRLSLLSKFARLDRLTGIGRYGVLLLGLDDVKEKEDFNKPVAIIGQRKLNYVKPLSENSAVIKDFEDDPTNERFGQPKTYEVGSTDPNNPETLTPILVHWSRIIHVTGDLLESEIYGTPRLRPIFNRLNDIEKLAGGSAEMFYRGARPGYQGKPDEDYNVTAEMQDTLQDQIDEYEHNLRRILINQGIELKPLAMQIADPSNHLDIQIQMISAETGIPKRILTGSERGELASKDDKDSWNELITSRREEFADPLIVTAFINRMILYRILPKPQKEGFSVVWVDLWAPSEKEKAEIGKTISEAIAFYTRNIESIALIPPMAFIKFILGLSDEKISLIEEEKKAQVNEEIEDFEGRDDG